MKRTITAALGAAMLFAAAACPAQDNKTSITVRIAVEKQVIHTGPYARYAQKFLGVAAPLADKQSCTITAAAIGVRNAAAVSQPDDFPANGPVTAVPHTGTPSEFAKVPIDRRDFTDRSLEEAARQAASALFSIRNHRMELITGVSGENVFGAGLAAALAELARLEEEYLALFMGKQSVQTIVRAYDLMPQNGETNRVVCRFSPVDGLLAQDDLSGNPVVLEMKITEQPVAPAPVKTYKNAPMVRKTIPATVACRLVDGKTELAREQIAMNQMGIVIDVPAN